MRKKGRVLLIASALALGLAAASGPAQAHDPADQTEKIGSCAPAAFDNTSPQADVRFMRVGGDKAGQLMIPEGDGVKQHFIDQGGGTEMSLDAGPTTEAEVCFTTSQAGTAPDEPQYRIGGTPLTYGDIDATGEAERPATTPGLLLAA